MKENKGPGRLAVAIEVNFYATRAARSVVLLKHLPVVPGQVRQRHKASAWVSSCELVFQLEGSRAPVFVAGRHLMAAKGQEEMPHARPTGDLQLHDYELL